MGYYSQKGNTALYSTCVMSSYNIFCVIVTVLSLLDYELVDTEWKILQD